MADHDAEGNIIPSIHEEERDDYKVEMVRRGERIQELAAERDAARAEVEHLNHAIYDAVKWLERTGVKAEELGLIILQGQLRRADHEA